MASKGDKTWKPTANDIVRMLAEKYGDVGRYAFMRELAPATGYDANTWIDAAVMHLWPSEQMRRIGFEVKVSRQDFLNELNQPNKNRWVRESFHEFYFVTGPNVIKTEAEVPTGDGWLLAQKSRIVTKITAQRNTTADMTDELIASMLRNIRKHSNLQLEKDEEKQRLKAYQSAVSEHLKSHWGVGIPLMHEIDGNHDAILQALKLCQMDDRIRQMIREADERLNEFRDSMIDGLYAYVAVASASLEKANHFNSHYKRAFNLDADDLMKLKRTRRRKANGRQVIAIDRRMDSAIKFILNEGAHQRGGK